MKTSGSYASILRGVSQQAPEVRQSGQHQEQVNLLADPVAGLTRRHGTQYKAHSNVYSSSNPSLVDSVVLTAEGYRKLEHSAGGKDYTIWMRELRSGRPITQALPPVICYNKTDHVFVPVLERTTGALEALHLWGMAAAVSLGKYVAYSKAQIPCSLGVPASADFPDNTSNSGDHAIIWVRGGAYSRTYRVKWAAGQASYTTPDASVANAAILISPANIATELAAALTAAGAVTTVIGSHIMVSGIARTVEVTDGGDGVLLRAVGNEVDDISKLTLLGRNGRLVRVGYTPSNPGYYLQAVTKSGDIFGECSWREASGSTRDGETLRGIGLMTVTSTQLEVGEYSPTNPTAGIANAPKWVSSFAGDSVSNPTPRWMNGQVTYMGMFQDRLLIAAGSALAVSAAGDYFNFFRSTVVTVPLRDAFEMTAQGGEDDVLRHGVAYNRNLVIFGDEKQYIISGTQALTPTSANMSIMTVYPGAATCPPLAAGGQIYYARNRDFSVALHQIQPGVYVDSAESFPTSAQISRYIPAPAADMTAVPGAPAQIVLRSSFATRELFIFSYLDAPDGRKQEAWSRWKYPDGCGNLVGVTTVPDGLVLVWARAYGGTVKLVADLQPISAETAVLPYLDSARTIGQLSSGATDIDVLATGWHMAMDRTTPRWLNGGRLEDREALQDEFPTEYPTCWVGLEHESFVTLTNPYIRDPSGQAVLSGRLTVSMLRANLKSSSGMGVTIETGGIVKQTYFNGRVLGDPANRIGYIPVTSGVQSIPIGRETRAYTVTLASRKWYPFTVVGIEWTGQSFNRTPRA